jgi:hypothetical protein
MTLQYSAAVRNAQLDTWETTIGTAPLLRLYSGAVPANCAASETGTLLAELTLPSDWMANASSGSKAKSGTWSGTGAVGAGTGTTTTHYRIYDAGGTTCHEQGAVTATGGGGDMTLDNVSIASGQAFAINTFTRTAGNA